MRYGPSWIFLGTFIFIFQFAGAAENPVASVKALKEKLSKQGGISIQGVYPLNGKEVPGLRFGDLVVNTNESVIVDAIKSELGGICTIFVRAGDDFIRVSTNALDKDGTRCMGTLLNRPGQVYSAVTQGKSYTGSVEICGDLYDAYYEPIFLNKKVIGIYLCGYLKK